MANNSSINEDDKRQKSRKRWRGCLVISIAAGSCLLALLGPLWSMVTDESISSDTTTGADSDTVQNQMWRRTKTEAIAAEDPLTPGGGAALYVWPQRLADDVVQGSNQRHYRRRRDLVWHPHPSYQLTLQDGTSWARLDLEPAGDDELFVSGRADVIQLMDEANNISSSMKPADWRPLRGCFYRGQVQQPRSPTAGRDSKVVLSLCHGLVNLE